MSKTIPWVLISIRFISFYEDRHNTSEELGEAGDTWRSGIQLTSRRYQHCGAVLKDGSVVLTGGQASLL
jgi:hypothetical protein